MTVADAMRKEVVVISPGATLRSACRIIFGGQVGGLPVVDKRGKLVGIVVEKDILRLFFPSSQEYVEDFTHAKDFQLMEEKISETLSLPVEKFMSRNPLTVGPQTPLLKAASLMITKRVGRLPVIDGHKKLVGILSHGDIFRSLVRKRIPSLKRGKKTGVDFFSRLASHYDLSFSWSQRLAEEIPFLVRALKKNKVRTVLDLGCGTGEHVIALAKLGFNLTGVDGNEEMLTKALEKSEKQKETVRQNSEFLCLPLDKIALLKGRQFDAAICLGNMLSFLLNYERELLSLKKVLKPKATLIIQIRNFDRILEEKERLINLNFGFGESSEGWEKEYAFLRFYDFRPDGLLNFNVETLANDGRIWQSYGVETNIQRPILKENLKRFLIKLGFSKIKFFGDFKGSPYHKDKSRFLIAVSSRN